MKKKIAILCAVTLLTTATTSAAVPRWEIRFHKSIQHLKQKKKALTRLMLRQTCALSLSDNSWHGVFEALTLLGYAKIKIPSYFSSYLKKALNLAIKQKSESGCMLLAQIALQLKKQKLTQKGFKACFTISYSNGNLYHATQAASMLRYTNARNEGLALLIRIAKLALQLERPFNTILAAQAMGKYGVKPAARHWLNQAAAMAMRKKYYRVLNKAIMLLDMYKFTQDAQYWKNRYHQGTNNAQ